VYWNLTDAAGTRTVDIYKDVAKTALVATGSRAGDGAIVLAASGGSGLSGTVNVTYLGDDTDNGNIYYINGYTSSMVWINTYYDETPIM
jgi:hypothetical protein